MSDPREAWWVRLREPRPYRAVWELQKRIHAARVAARVPDVLLVLEHRPVVTLGRAGGKQHLLLPQEEFQRRGVELVESDRGGDVTYHGPGQLVAYFLVGLETVDGDVARLVRQVEEVAIRVADRFGVRSGRWAGYPGAWCGPEKLAAVGMRIREGVSLHGMALNVENDLAPFGWIVPCGIEGHGATSLSREAGRRIPLDQVVPVFVEEAAAVFGWRLRPLEEADLAALLGAGSGSDGQAERAVLD
ncbi:MAG: lipoyl(octanoyl) transferase LipB [Bacillota bacterium]|nr:lipoyl(octanoyl) transferase LipB [Bacillota bacterium]